MLKRKNSINKENENSLSYLASVKRLKKNDSTPRKKSILTENNENEIENDSLISFSSSSKSNSSSEIEE